MGYQAVVWSFLFSLVAIIFMMKWLRTKTFVPFVIYRIILGVMLLLDAYNIL
jgi:undecaprenyl-diphosphatase